jgi:ElaB/YqjD/DUF883 family membrane-anchored ribosome-binding protein
MSEPTTTSSPAAPSGSGTTEQAKAVASDAAARAQDVAGDAAAQARAVARDASHQVRDLVGRSRDRVDEEARIRSRQAAGNLRSLGDQLGALGDGDPARAGALGDYANQGRDALNRLAERLDDGPQAVLDDVRRFARRQPVLFLAAAGALGFVTGRLVRAANRDGAQPSPPPMPGQPPTPVTATVIEQPAPTMEDLAP